MYYSYLEAKMEVNEFSFSRKRPRLSLYDYKLCPHCSKEMSIKKFKEHERLFYDSCSRKWCVEEKDKSDSDESSVFSSIEDLTTHEQVLSDDFEDILTINQSWDFWQ